MGAIDIIVFVGFVAAVIAIGLWKSRGEDLKGEKGAQDYFLAGRGLTWWLVGFSLIAANISTEQFVGMSGKAADWLGMAIASYEWMAAITLVVVAFLFLPKFLKSGIYTIPEFLEYRYNAFARFVMAVATLIVLVGVPTASVIYSGAKVITVNFQGKELLGLDLGSLTVACWIIGTLAAIYVFTGGLKACAWADLIQGSALIIGGGIIAYLAMRALGDADTAALAKTATDPANLDVAKLEGAGAWERLKMLNAGDAGTGKMHMVKPADDPEIPWTALVVGLWIPNFFYWGLNQYITQRTLGSKSLAEGQRGIVFAAFLKLLIPFLVVIPGILAFNLFTVDLETAATVKNAKAIATYAPNLYETLSDEVKPDPDNDLFINDIKAINKRLEDAKADPSEKAIVFKFTDVFSTDQPEDAKRILEYNALKANFSITEPVASPEAILKMNEVILAEVKGNENSKMEELVLRDYDAAFPVLIKNLLPVGWGLKGFVLAAIFGAVVSSLASMLNSSSTIFTMDIYKKWINPKASQYALVTSGRICVAVFVVIAMFIAPTLDSPKFGGIFTFIQEFQGFLSPGILGIFLFGVLIHKAPRMCGTVGILLNIVLYGALKWLPATSEIAFLNRMAICFAAVLGVLALLTVLFPLKQPVELPVNENMDMTTKNDVKIWGAIVVVLTIILYIIFW